MEFEVESCDLSTKDYKFSSVPVLSKELSYDDFFRTYMQPNLPCVIENVTTDWQAHFKWLNNNNKPNLDYLRSQYGSCDVTVYNCNEKYFNSQKTEACKLSHFFDLWGQDSSKFKYLKDWHLKNTFKNDDFYQVPVYFASDWLNEFLTENNEDDYRFVYMGQAGTWTPFHADVFNSFSWSANVCGKKRWILFPPGEETFFKDSLNNLAYDISDVYKTREHFELVQNPGEAIFVPSGWYHQVWNLEDTISVNHNWVNGCNIMKMWRAIEENLASVKKEIEDCEDMDGFNSHCQIMLKASFGIDFFRFYEFLEFIALRRLSQVENNRTEILFHGHSLGVKHATFDLVALKSVLEEFIQHCDVPKIFNSDISKPEKLLQKIRDSVKVY
ncbi:2-oxoglutarate and iron-dependent oxygenase JMJD4 [Zophobas morio]|uniref:2-oxoglutarate and iron-dependent oxygenase JMJD4 n=1 Tax=Zophobas morio TaxID=2755281 RepID=UPI003082DD88